MFLEPGRSCLCLAHSLTWGRLPLKCHFPKKPFLDNLSNLYPSSIPTWALHSTCFIPFRARASIRVLQRNGTDRSPLHINIEIYFEEVVHAIVEVGESAICRAGPQAGKWGRISCHSLEDEFLFLRVTSAFALQGLQMIEWIPTTLKI